MGDETIETLNLKYTEKCAAIADAQFKIKNHQRFIDATWGEVEAIDARAVALRNQQINDSQNIKDSTSPKKKRVQK